jgi:glucokinase
MDNAQIIGIDLGGTNLRAGVVSEGVLQPVISRAIYGHETQGKVLDQIFNVVDEIINNEVAAIGMGVAGLVDPSSGILYDAVNIPSLSKMDLRSVLEQRYNIPVKIENDANCFTLGEFYFGGAKSYDSVVGLTIGTGLGTGIIANGKLFTGKHGGAGEFGMISYLDKNIEYYVSGRFFEHMYRLKGEDVHKRALAGDTEAIGMYGEFGRHLGEAIKLILYALDTECFVIGGSLKTAFPFYSQSMWDTVAGFEYKRIVSTLKIEASSLANSNLLGAAALHFSIKQQQN